MKRNSPLRVTSIAILAFTLVSGSVFLGCVKRVPMPETQTSDDTVVIDRKEFLAMARLKGGDSTDVPDSILFRPETIYPGDQVGISLYEKLPISMEKRLEIKRVDGRGMIFLLPMGSIKIGGLTTAEAEQRIAEKLSEYVVSPHVELSITEREIGKEQVYIFGNVSAQGTYTLKDNYRLLDLFSQAGGISTSLFARPVKLIRVSGDKVTMTNIDLKDIFRGGQLEKNVVLQNQDIVYVPPRYFESTKEMLGLIGELLPWYFCVYTLFPTK